MFPAEHVYVETVLREIGCIIGIGQFENMLKYLSKNPMNGAFMISWRRIRALFFPGSYNYGHVGYFELVGRHAGKYSCMWKVTEGHLGISLVGYDANPSAENGIEGFKRPDSHYWQRSLFFFL